MVFTGIRLLFFGIYASLGPSPATTPSAEKEKNATEFVLIRESGGIEIYERWFSSGTDATAREVKATFSTAANAHAAVALIRDEKKGMAWNKSTCAYRMTPEGQEQWVGYIQYDLPWPVSNQECVLQYRQMVTAQGMVVGFQSIEHGSFPKRRGVTRIQNVNGKWVFTPNDQGGTDVEYYITTTPNKKLPGWVTDPIIRNNLIDTMHAFRTILEHQSSADN